MDYAKEKAGDLMHFFGYADIDEDTLPQERRSTCKTPFFSLKSSPDQVESYNQFKLCNTQSLENRLQYKAGSAPKDKIQINTALNDPRDAIKMVSIFEVSKNAHVNQAFDYDVAGDHRVQQKNE